MISIRRIIQKHIFLQEILIKYQPQINISSNITRDFNLLITNILRLFKKLY